MTRTGHRRGTEGAASTWVLLDGRRMHARVPAGQLGDPRGGDRRCDAVVLVHGLGVSSRYMLPTLNLLAPRYPVFAPDLPGFGRTDKPKHPLSLAELADSLAEWMTATGLDQAVLLGNSLGCQVITEFAGRHTARLCRAVLVGPTCDPHAPSPWRQAARLLLDAPREKPAEAALAVVDYWRAGPRRIWTTLGEALHSPVASQLAQMHMPTLVVRGGRDPIVSQQWAEQVTDLLPHGHLVTIPDAPHAANYSAAPTLVRHVTAFLDRHENRRRLPASG